MIYRDANICVGKSLMIGNRVGSSLTNLSSLVNLVCLCQKVDNDWADAAAICSDNVVEIFNIW